MKISCLAASLAHLLLAQVWLECSQEIPAGVGGLDKGIHWGKEVGGEELCNLLEIGAGRDGSLQQVVSYRAGGETGDLELEERKER